MDLCRFQVAVLVAISVILIFIALFFATALLALNLCIIGNLWIAAVCGIGRQCWSRCRMWIAALLKHHGCLALIAISNAYFFFFLGWLYFFSDRVVAKHML